MLLYLLHPHQPLKWLDFPSSYRQLAVDQGLDVGALDGWQVTEERQTSTGLLRTALRHGDLSAAGIVVPAIHVITLERGDELRRLTQRTHEARKALEPTYEVLDSVMPGNREARTDLDARVNAETTAAIRDADDEGHRELEAKPQAALVEHWRALGGYLPDPL